MKAWVKNERYFVGHSSFSRRCGVVCDMQSLLRIFCGPANRDAGKVWCIMVVVYICSALAVTSLVLGVRAMRHDEIIGGLLIGLAFMFIGVCIIGMLEGGGT